MRIINADTQSIHYTSPQLYTGWSRSIKPLTSRLTCLTLSNINWQCKAANKNNMQQISKHMYLWKHYFEGLLQIKNFFSTYHQIRDFACRSTTKYPFFQFFTWLTDVLKNWIPYISYHTLCSPVNAKLRIYRISTLYF